MVETHTDSVVFPPVPKNGHGKVAKKRALFNAWQYVKRAPSACNSKQKGTFKTKVTLTKVTLLGRTVTLTKVTLLGRTFNFHTFSD